MGHYDSSAAYGLAPVDGNERAAAALAHAGFFLGGPFVVPLAVWLLYPLVGQSAYVRHQAVQAMLFHLVTMVIGTIFIVIVGLAFFGSIFASMMAASVTQWLHMAWPVTIALGIAGGAFSLWSVVIMVVAVYKVATGQPYRMPLTGGLS